jgi:hypothetical protein
MKCAELADRLVEIRSVFTLIGTLPTGTLGVYTSSQRLPP